MPSRALLVTNLHPATPFAMLNACMGDAGDLIERPCGCPVEALGWSPHIANVRSYEKLTAGGTTFDDSDLIDVLERVLPGQFGGTATDYQLVERDDAHGRPTLALRVHPRLGPLDDAAVAEAFLQAVGTSPVGRAMVEGWRQTGMVRVEREAPHATSSAKILHLHVERPKG
jgi:hypothetical protein